MRRHKGEMSTFTIDRDFPHQVAIEATAIRGSGGEVIDRFCVGLSRCPRHHRYFVHNPSGACSEYIVYCFKEQQDAGYFAHHIGAAIAKVWHGQKVELIDVDERISREKAYREAVRKRSRLSGA